MQQDIHRTALICK